MRVKSINIKNYMPFFDSGDITFESRFNVIIGKNNVGKSALLNVFRLEIQDFPHRSLITLPTPGQKIENATSEASIEFVIENSHIKNVMLRDDETIVLPEQENRSGQTTEYDNFKQLLKEDADSTTVTYTITASGVVPTYDAFGLYETRSADDGRFYYRRFERTDEGEYNRGGRTIYSRPEETMENKLFGIIRNSVFSFNAERPRIGRSAHGTSTVLKSDASNLPEVLDNLQENQYRFVEFNRLVTSVFPLIKWISVRNIANSQLEIRIWMVDPATQRDDLAVPLIAAGTGVGQVLSMLYVVFTAPESKVIVIDVWLTPLSRPRNGENKVKRKATTT